MQYEKFIQPRSIEIDGKEFVISKIPAVDAIPIHNIIAKSIVDNGIIGITMLPFEIDKQLLGYCALISGDLKIVPNTDTLINDVFKGNVGTIKALVIELVKENFGFLTSGDLLSRLSALGEATESAS